MDYDPLICRIAEYACAHEQFSEEAVVTARLALLDSLGCCAPALAYDNCQRHLRGLDDGGQGTLDVPFLTEKQSLLQGAKSLSVMIRWLDFNDTWLAQEWGHPSDNIGPILMLGQYLKKRHDKAFPMKELLRRMIQAYEIQGILALSNSFNRRGIDHVILVKLASAAICAAMLSGDDEEVAKSAISHVFADGHSLRCYRHYPNTGPRKSWAAGDAAARGLQLALLAHQGEPGIPGVLSTGVWGLEAVMMRGRQLSLTRRFNCYVMENILFKVSYPAEFHAQTAVEAAIKLHHCLHGDLTKITAIELLTHEAAIRIINKTGELRNHADRDHCLQYMVAVALLKGDLQGSDYKDEAAANEDIDKLRLLMKVSESKKFSHDYLDIEKRAVANEVKLIMKDGTSLRECIEYPLGHRCRREESRPTLLEKFSSNMSSCCKAEDIDSIKKFILDETNEEADASEICRRLKAH